MTFTQEIYQQENRVEQKAFPETSVRLAMAFIKQKYPLTLEGQLFKSQVTDLIINDDFAGIKEIEAMLPTVENPHSEYFADFELDKEEILKYLGFNGLQIFQTTKGCLHYCKHCCFAAGQKVEIMPFAAVVKFAEISHGLEEEARAAYNEWLDYLANLIGSEFLEFREVSQAYIENRTTLDDLNFYKDLIWEMLCAKFGSPEQTKNTLYQIYQESHIATYFPVPAEYLDNTDFDDFTYQSYSQCLYGSHNPNFDDIAIVNYFDNDVFSYRDANFRHEDGSSADYADVFMTIATELRPIHITTAGWFLNDAVAQRAANKLVAHLKEYPEHLAYIRISISPYERVAVQDYDLYFKMMINVIITLKDLCPEVIFETDERMEPTQALAYQQKVLDPLRAIINDLNKDVPDDEFWNKVKINDKWTISYFSGRMASDDAVDDPYIGIPSEFNILHPYIVQPDGLILEDKNEYKGQLPTSTGKYLFKL